MASLNKKKVLIIVENLPVPFDRRVWLEANTLKKNGASVCVICPKKPGYEKSYEEINGIKVYRHSLREASSKLGYFFEYSQALLNQFFLSWKIFFKHGFHIIHACNPPDLIFLVAIPFKLFGVKFIFDHHDINPELYFAKFGKQGIFWHLLIFFEKMSFFFSDIVISTNESYKEIAVTRGRKNEKSVFVVRSGPDVNKLIYSYNEKHKNKKAYLVSYVGVMGEQEGIDLLLQSIQFIITTKKRTDIHFKIIGGGPAYQSLVKTARDMNLTEHVEFTGRVSDEELFETLNSSDVCVNPDKPNEMNDKSTMNKILEYMAFSKPIVQYDLLEGRRSASSSSLYAINGDTEDFGAKILQLLDNRELRISMGKIGKERLYNELSWEHQEASLLAAYEAALKNNL